MNNVLKNKKGFTLIEVLIAIVIIGIMSAVTILSYKGYVKKSNEAATSQEIQQVAQALEIGVLDDTFDPNSTYTYEQLKTVYEKITGYALPFSDSEIEFTSKKLKITKRGVTATYDFTTKEVTLA